jgi:WD40-like Beta Propeller Repeat
MKRSVLVLGLVVLALLVVSAPALADVFGPIQLASSGSLVLEGSAGSPEQALYAHDPTVSGNGRYVAFDGYFGGLAGVWRRDLQTGEVRPVAVGAEIPGSEACVSSQAPCDAELPSISENGQYVSFTTTAPLAPGDDTNSAPDVYVRNMEISESQPCDEESLHPPSACAYTLVSALNGSAEGLAYEDEGSRQYGSVAAGHSAITANGQQVAFVTTAVSDLAGPGTPALQVALRNLQTGETELVSAEYDPSTGQDQPGKPVSVTEGSTTIGAVYSSLTTPPFFPFNNRAYGLAPAVGASISADGSTVAWMGRDINRQALMLPDENISPTYAEPLWRRVANGSSTPTRRVTGGSQPEAPGCAASGEKALSGGVAGQSLSDPCQGPFAVESKTGVWAASVGNAIPQLSGNGWKVAFLASAQLVSLGVDFGRSSEGEADDLYLANMQEGLSRNEALQPLTELASGHESEPGPDAPIVDVAVSPDGNQVAFSTERTEFPLGTPAYVSEPAAVAGMAELFDADLLDDTLTRVTGGYQGGPSERPHKTSVAGESDPYRLRTDGALSPSFSNDGNILAFSSTASNLVYGDGNTPSEEPRTGSADGSDVFDVERQLFPPTQTETYVAGSPAGPAVMPTWLLGVTALRLSNGSVRLYVEVPGSGTLSAAADSAVRLVSVSHSTKRGRSSSRRARVSTKVSVLKVASARKNVSAGGSGLVVLTLTLSSRYKALATSSTGLSSTVDVVFSAPGHPTLRQSLVVAFKQKTKKKAPAKKRKAKAGSKR